MNTVIEECGSERERRDRAEAAREHRRRTARTLRLTAVLYVLFAAMMLMLTDWSQAPSGQTWRSMVGPAIYIVLAVGNLVSSFFPAAMQANGWEVPSDERDRYVALKANALRARVMDFALVGVVMVAWFVGFVALDSGVVVEAAASSVMLVAVGLSALSFALRLGTAIYFDRTC